MTPKIKITSESGWNAEAAALAAAMCRLARIPFLDRCGVAFNTPDLTVWADVKVITATDYVPPLGYVFFAHRLPGGLDLDCNLEIAVENVRGVQKLLQS